MVQRFCNHAAMLVLGIFVGMLLIAAWHGVGQGVQVQASATQGESNFAIATGLIDNGVEGLYFLDYLTGDLRAVVLNRRTGRFSGFFEYNIQADFAAVTSKNPKFLMVTGLVDVPRGRGPTQIGSSAIFIAEATSGLVNAYAIKWNSSMYAAGKDQKDTFVLLDGAQMRTTFVRDE